MTPEEKLCKKICATLYIMKWREIAELGVNAQQVQKIKRGEQVRFYGKTLERLKRLVN